MRRKHLHKSRDGCTGCRLPVNLPAPIQLAGSPPSLPAPPQLAGYSSTCWLLLGSPAPHCTRFSSTCPCPLNWPAPRHLPQAISGCYIPSLRSKRCCAAFHRPSPISSFHVILHSNRREGRQGRFTSSPPPHPPPSLPPPPLSPPPASATARAPMPSPRRRRAPAVRKGGFCHSQHSHVVYEAPPGATAQGARASRPASATFSA